MLALISGASRGIGAACALALAKEGCDIIINFKSDRTAAERTESRIGVLGRKTWLCRFDVSDPASVREGCEKIIKDIGVPDILVNNAGVSISGLVQDMTDADWDALMGANLKGMFNLCREIVPGMVERKSGCIVNISSMWGQTGASFESVYSASKGGVDAFTKALAKELGPSGIRVNAVSPGCILTDMCAEYSEEDLDALAEQSALGRNGTPEDIANAVAFLASEKASFITGQILGVNGGMVI